MNLDLENWHSCILNRKINLKKIPREALIRELIKEREESLRFEAEFGKDLERKQEFLSLVLNAFKQLYPEKFQVLFGKKRLSKIIRNLLE